MSPSRRCLSATWGGHLPAQPGRAALSMRKSCAKGSAPHRKIDRPGKIPDRKREVGSGRKHVRMGKMQPTWPIPPTRCFIPHQLLQAGAPRSRTGATAVPPATDVRGAEQASPLAPRSTQTLVPRAETRFRPTGWRSSWQWHSSCSTFRSKQSAPPPAGRRQETE